MKKVLNQKNISAFVFITFAASAVYVIAQLAAMPPAAEANIRSAHMMMLLQCVLGMVIILLPEILRRRAGVNLPPGMVIVFALFLFCAIYLGEIHNFYFRIPHWDTMLHTFSGAALGVAGFSIIRLLNKTKNLAVSPALAAMFAFCFAVAAGVVWEVFEFGVDTVLGSNMQRFSTEHGEALAGQAAIVDTMKDLIVDTLGALISAVGGYVAMRKKDKRLISF